MSWAVQGGVATNQHFFFFTSRKTLMIQVLDA